MTTAKQIKELEEIIEETVNQYSQTAKEDLERFAAPMAADAARAAATGNVMLQEELVAQGKLLAEKHRVQLNGAGWDVFAKVTQAAVRIMVAALPVALLVLTTAGCTARKTVLVENIAPAIRKVAERHDAYVRQDPTLSPDDKATYLRTTELLLEVVDQ